MRRPICAEKRAAWPGACALILLFSLTGCDGGGGNDGAQRPPVNPPPAVTDLAWDEGNWDELNWQ